MDFLLVLASAGTPLPHEPASEQQLVLAAFLFLRHELGPAVYAAARVLGLRAPLRAAFVDAVPPARLGLAPAGYANILLGERDTGAVGCSWADAEVEVRGGAHTVGRRPGWASSFAEPVTARCVMNPAADVVRLAAAAAMPGVALLRKPHAAAGRLCSEGSS